MLCGDAAEVLLLDVQPGQQRERYDAPGRVPGEQPENHPHMPA